MQRAEDDHQLLVRSHDCEVPSDGGDQTPFRYHRQPLYGFHRRPATLPLTARDPEGSRSARRLRRESHVPGVIYGGGDEPAALRGRRAHAAQHARPRRPGHRGRLDGGSNAQRPDQGRAAPPGPRRGRARRPPARPHGRRDPRDRADRVRRLRRGARRERGRHLQPGAARGEHRGAAGRHPGLDRPRRLGPGDERDGHARRADRARRASRCSTTPRSSSPRSPRRRSSRSKRRSRPRPRWSARTASRSSRRGREGEEASEDAGESADSDES